MKPNNVYFLAHFTRSFDNLHLDNNIMHLVGSVFYTNDLKLNSSSLDEEIILVKLNSSSLDIRITRIRPKIILIELSFVQFFGYYADYLKGVDTSSGSGLVEIIFGPKSLKDNNKLNKFPNVLFVIPNVDWSSLQTYFSQNNVKLSGGSINKRCLVSTTDFNLIKMLISLGYTAQDVYNNQQYHVGHKNTDNVPCLVSSTSDDIFTSVRLDRNVMSNIITKALISRLNEINKSILNKEDELKVKSSNLKSLEKKLLDKKSEKQKGNKEIESPQIKKITGNIAGFKELNLKVQNDISNLKLEKLQNNKEIENLDKLSYQDLKNKYLTNYHNSKLRMDLLFLQEYFNSIVKGPSTSRSSHH